MQIRKLRVSGQSALHSKQFTDVIYVFYKSFIYIFKTRSNTMKLRLNKKMSQR